MSDTTVEPDPQQQLDWESANRTKAVIAATVGGIFTIAPTVYIGLTGFNTDAPEVGPLQALTPALSGQVAAEVDPRTALVHYWADHPAPALIAGVMQVLGMIGIAYVLWYLFVATRARRPGLPAFTRYLSIVGPLLLAISAVGVPLARYLGSKSYLDGSDKSSSAVDHALGGGGVLVLGTIGLVGLLALALAFVLIALNAMRAGLLTQFMGIIGMLVGGLYVLQIGAPAPVLQAFWLLALVPLFLQRWPNGTPPAWTRGVAVPWPTAAERRAAAQPAAAGASSAAASSDLADDAADPRPAPNRPQHTSRKRRKR